MKVCDCCKNEFKDKEVSMNIISVIDGNSGTSKVFHYFNLCELCSYDLCRVHIPEVLRKMRLENEK